MERNKSFFHNIKLRFSEYFCIRHICFNNNRVSIVGEILLNRALRYFCRFVLKTLIVKRNRFWTICSKPVYIFNSNQIDVIKMNAAVGPQTQRTEPQDFWQDCFYNWCRQQRKVGLFRKCAVPDYGPDIVEDPKSTGVSEMQSISCFARDSPAEVPATWWSEKLLSVCMH